MAAGVGAEAWAGRRSACAFGDVLPTHVEPTSLERRVLHVCTSWPWLTIHEPSRPGIYVVLPE